METLQQAPQGGAEQLPQWMAGLQGGGYGFDGAPQAMQSYLGSRAKDGGQELSDAAQEGEGGSSFSDKLNNPMNSISGGLRNSIAGSLGNRKAKGKKSQSKGDPRKQQLQQSYNQNQSSPLNTTAGQPQSKDGQGSDSVVSDNDDRPMTNDQQRALKKATGGSKLPEGGMGRQRPDRQKAQTPQMREQQEQQQQAELARRRLQEVAKLKRAQLSRGLRKQALKAIRESGSEGKKLAETLDGPGVTDAEFSLELKLAVIMDLLSLLGTFLFNFGVATGGVIFTGVVGTTAAIPVIGPWIAAHVGTSVGAGLGAAVGFVLGWSGYAVVVMIQIPLYFYMWWYLHYRLTVYEGSLLMIRKMFIKFFTWAGFLAFIPNLNAIPFMTCSILLGWFFTKMFADVASEKEQDKEIQKQQQKAATAYS